MLSQSVLNSLSSCRETRPISLGGMEAGTIVALLTEELLDFWLLFADYRLNTRYIYILLTIKRNESDMRSKCMDVPIFLAQKNTITSPNVTVAISIPCMLIHCL